MKVRVKNIPFYGNLYEEMTLKLDNIFYCNKVVYDKPDRYGLYCWKITLHFFLGKLIFSTKEKYYDF